MQNNIVSENDMLKISFVPHIWVDDDIEPIKASHENYTHLLQLIRSNTWKKYFLKYNFDELRPYLLPYYTPEMYYAKNIITNLDIVRKTFVITIIFMIKKYSYDTVKQKYLDSFALNKTWNDKITKKLTLKHIEELVKDGFYKCTEEGEILIPHIGSLRIEDFSVKFTVYKI